MFEAPCARLLIVPGLPTGNHCIETADPVWSVKNTITQTSDSEAKMRPVDGVAMRDRTVLRLKDAARQLNAARRGSQAFHTGKSLDNLRKKSRFALGCEAMSFMCNLDERLISRQSRRKLQSPSRAD